MRCINELGWWLVGGERDGEDAKQPAVVRQAWACGWLAVCALAVRLQEQGIDNEELSDDIQIRPKHTHVCV